MLPFGGATQRPGRHPISPPPQPRFDGPEGSWGSGGTPVSPGLTKIQTQHQSACQAPTVLTCLCPLSRGRAGTGSSAIRGKGLGWEARWPPRQSIKSLPSTYCVPAVRSLRAHCLCHRTSFHPPPSCPKRDRNQRKLLK